MLPFECDRWPLVISLVMACCSLVGKKYDTLARMLAAVWNLFFLNCTENHRLIDIASSALLWAKRFFPSNHMKSHIKYNRKVVCMAKSMYRIDESSSNGFFIDSHKWIWFHSSDLNTSFHYSHYRNRRHYLLCSLIAPFYGLIQSHWPIE